MQQMIPELLAPAGNYEAFTGAVNAGADAVYLAGKQFGARAYADNFTDEEVIKAIRYAHLIGKKIYLTVNTLMKQKEIELLPQYLYPFYEEGLDAVIIQDVGALFVIRDRFPKLECHASTQMTITSAYGAEFAKEMGVNRVVPARELSLREMTEIKEKTGLELEAFIHGSMCYCYSGQCLMSSLIGGRSGNRGRCAQPCRLPYHVGKERGESYPLSMKDMCTTSILPELVKAGIDSFKIEGRMKRPEYSAAVTGVYRKLLDRICEGKQPDLDEAARSIVHTFYIRSEIGDGYYHRYNGKEMITVDSPAYVKTEESLAEQIRKQYIDCGLPKIPIHAEITLHLGCPAVLKVSREDSAVTIQGPVVEEAKRAPLGPDSIEKQLKKCNDTPFCMEEIQIHSDDNIFMPVSILNQLRRDALDSLYAKLTERKTYIAHIQGEHSWSEKGVFAEKERSSYRVCVMTAEQYEACKGYQAEFVFPLEWLFHPELATIIRKEKQLGRSVYLVLPPILRRKLEADLHSAVNQIKELKINGFYTGQNDILYLLQKLYTEIPVYGMPNLYCMNEASLEVYLKYLQGYMIPYEMNAGQIKDLTSKSKAEIQIYGYQPLMYSANCVQRTMFSCQGTEDKKRGKDTSNAVLTNQKDASISGSIVLTDRYQNQFNVKTDCRYCTNTIYNCVPLSLHREMNRLKQMGINRYLISFTMESGQEVLEIMERFLNGREDLTKGKEIKYTCGHFNRGVE